MELRRGTFEITLDGKTVGSVDRNESFERPIEPGRYTLQVREGRSTSRAVAFVVGNGDSVTFRCNGAIIWPVYLASLVVPSLALTLKQV
jgi:hypothetical protein